MENAEGLIAEEVTEVESVQNETPEPIESEEVPAEQGEEETIENAESSLSDEELGKLLDDPRVKERIEAEVETKTSRQKAANRQLQRKYEDARERLLQLKEQDAPTRPELSDFETDADYEKALEDYNDERFTRKAQEAMLEQEAQAAADEQINQARETFQTLETEIKEAVPEYDDNVKVVQSYIDMIPQGDKGFEEFGKYMTLECENAPALLNHLGENPDKIEALLGKPPALIKRKLEGYMKEVSELSTPKQEQPEPLPNPPKKVRGNALSKSDPLKMNEADFMKKYL